MNSDIMECYLQAGKIASEVKAESLKTVEEGIKLLETAEYAEELILQKGGELAFPCNISVNQIASHYTPLYGRSKFNTGDLVKIDLGAHIDGYIADTAATTEVGTDHNNILIKAANEALNAAISQTKHGVNTKHLGSIMGKIIKSYGCNPVKDLTGHSIDRFTIHSGVNIPNYGGAPYGNTLYEGDVIAIEPFTTKGRGRITQGDARIFSLRHTRNLSNPLYQKLESRFNKLPFTSRWLTDHSEIKNTQSLLKKYPILIESDGCPVAQAEHTVIVMEQGCKVITA
jgi:methionyl aminopeptidase